MSEPIIHVIPEAYYGGAAPKVSRKEVFKAEGAPGTLTSKLKITASPKVMLIAIIAVLFVIVVSGASWYFIRNARPVSPPAPPPAPELPVVVPVKEEPIEPEPAHPDSGRDQSGEPAQQPELGPPSSPGQDTDSDGISDTEEVLYGGQVSVPDTDNDGFIDGHEVFNLYNPSGIAPQRLEAAGHAKKYSNEIAGYAVFIPALWQATALPENPYLVVIKDRVGKDVFEIEFIRDASSSAPVIEGASDWSTNKFGLSGFISPDKQRAYFTKNNAVYMIRYKEGQNIDEYKTTFGVLLNSFELR